MSLEWRGAPPAGSAAAKAARGWLSGGHAGEPGAGEPGAGEPGAEVLGAGDPGAEKRRLRAALRAARRALVGDARAAASAAAQRTALRSLEALPARRWLLYRAFDGEVETTAIEARAHALQIPVRFARVGQDGGLEWVEVVRWREGPRGLPLPEGPSGGCAAGDVVVVPGVAFDPEGYRIGLGGGAYDRSLGRAGVFTLGLAFDFQRVARAPREPWDVPVQALATDAGLYGPLAEGRDT